MAIDKNLQALAEKLKLRLKRQNSNFNFSPSQIRDEIKKVSTDYANITFEQETLIMDNLIKSQCDLTETEDPTLKLDKQTLENLTENNQGVTEMNDANNQQQSALTVNSQQSSAITFGDDLDKANEVRSLAATQNIQLTGREAFEVAQNVGNQFNSTLELLQAIISELAIRQNKSDNEILINISNTLAITEENSLKASIRGLDLVKSHIKRTQKIKSEGVEEIKKTFDEFWKVTGM